MHEIICPHCQKAFKVDEAGYAEILKQVRDSEFDEQLHERLLLAEQENTRRPPRASHPNPPRTKHPPCGYRLSIPRKRLHFGPPICPLHEIPMETVGDCGRGVDVVRFQVG